MYYKLLLSKKIFIISIGIILLTGCKKIAHSIKQKPVQLLKTANDELNEIVRETHVKVTNTQAKKQVWPCTEEICKLKDKSEEVIKKIEACLDCKDVPDEKKAQLYQQKEALNAQVAALDSHKKNAVDKQIGKIDEHTKALKTHGKILSIANVLHTILIITIIVTTIVTLV